MSPRILPPSSPNSTDEIIRIYSDGACSNNQQRINFGGWGAILLWKDKLKEICGGQADTTNQRMELMAIIKALEELKNPRYPVEIFSDSAYIVDCITKKWYLKWQRNGWLTANKEPVKNQDLWVALLNNLRPLDYHFTKVKGHSGDQWNERADVLARSGLEKSRSATES